MSGPEYADGLVPILGSDGRFPERFQAAKTPVGFDVQGSNLIIHHHDGTDTVVPNVNLKGDPGTAGRGIASVNRTTGDGSAGSTDTYTITYTVGPSTTFQVVNGSPGVKGDTPTAADISAVLSQNPSVAQSAATLAQSDAGLARTSDPRLPQPADTGTTDLLTPVDSAGNELWTGINGVDGGPTTLGRIHIRESVGISYPSIPGRSVVVQDEAGNEMWTSANDTDGGPTEVGRYFIRTLSVGSEPTYSPQAKEWNPARGTYGVSPRTMQPWLNRAAFAASGQRVASINIPGTSRWMGAGTPTDKWKNSPAGRLRQRLDQWMGLTSGTGWVPVMDRKWDAYPDARMTRGPGTTLPATNAGYGPHQQCGVNVGSGTDQWWQFATTQATTSMQLMTTIPAGASGLATVKIDGASVGTISLAADGSGGASIARDSGTPTNMAVYTISGLPAATHTLRIDGVTSGGLCVPVAGRGNTGVGIDINDWSRGGGQLSQWTKADADNRYGMQYWIDYVKPDLTILGDFTNDRLATIGDVKAWFRTLIERSLAVGSSILLMPLAMPDLTGQDGAGANPGRWNSHVETLYRLNDEYGLSGVLDTTWLWRDYAHANDPAGLFVDTLHEGPPGIWRIADSLNRLLTAI